MTSAFLLLFVLTGLSVAADLLPPFSVSHEAAPGFTVLSFSLGVVAVAGVSEVGFVVLRLLGEAGFVVEVEVFAGFDAALPVGAASAPLEFFWLLTAGVTAFCVSLVVTFVSGLRAAGFTALGLFELTDVPVLSA